MKQPEHFWKLRGEFLDLFFVLDVSVDCPWPSVGVVDEAKLGDAGGACGTTPALDPDVSQVLDDDGGQGDEESILIVRSSQDPVTSL